MREALQWLRRLPRALLDLLWLLMVLSLLWVALGRPASTQSLRYTLGDADLTLLYRSGPSRLKIRVDGETWVCSPSQPAVPGDDHSLAPTGRHSAIQPIEIGTHDTDTDTDTEEQR